MMIYQRKNRRGSRKKYFWFAAAAVVCAYLLNLSAPNLLSGLFVSLGVPIWNAKNAVSDQVALDLSFYSRGELIDLNRGLKEQLAEKELQAAAVSALLNENRDLKSILGREEDPSGVLTVILARPPSTLYDTFVLDAGTETGIEKGDIVVAFGLYPVGQITEVFGRYSRAKLFSSSGNQIGVLIGDNSTAVYANGMGGYFVAEVPQEFEVERGDAVVFSDISLRIFGFVSDVESRPASPFKYVFFANPVNMNSIKFVMVEKNVQLEPKSEESLP